MKYLKTFVSAIIAGMCIGMGGIVFLSLENKIAGAFFFTTGLFVICLYKFNLFTGKVCYVFQKDKEYALNLPIIWAGNLAGAWLIAMLTQATRINGISEKASTICQIKNDDSFISLFVLGILCDILIYIAVEGYATSPYEIGKHLSIFFGVMVFIFCGFEHCVADMFYYSVAGMWNGDSLLRVVIISLGNAVGGVFIPLLRSFIEEKNTQSEVKN